MGEIDGGESKLFIMSNVCYYICMSPVLKKKKKILKKKVVKKTKKKDVVEKVNSLNPNEKLFCQLYFGGGEFFGNGVWSYIKAYNYNVPFIPISFLNTKQKKQYNVARSGAYEILTKPDIVKEGERILDSFLKNDVVDRELVKIIMQDKDKMSKNVAIKEFNRLKNRVSDKVDLTSDGKKIQPIIQLIQYGTPDKV